MSFSSNGPCECTGQIWSPYSFTLSCDNSDWSFGWGLRTPNLGEDDAVGGRDGTVRKSVGEFLRDEQKHNVSVISVGFWLEYMHYGSLSGHILTTSGSNDKWPKHMIICRLVPKIIAVTLCAQCSEPRSNYIWLSVYLCQSAGRGVIISTIVWNLMLIVSVEHYNVDEIIHTAAEKHSTAGWVNRCAAGIATGFVQPPFKGYKIVIHQLERCYFSRSHCCLMIRYWHVTVVCLSACLFVTKCIVAKHPTAKVSDQVNRPYDRKCPPINTILALLTP